MLQPEQSRASDEMFQVKVFWYLRYRGDSADAAGRFEFVLLLIGQSLRYEIEATNIDHAMRCYWHT